MGQKVTPTGFRLGITYKPQSQWFVDPRNGLMKKIYPPLIMEDKFIRDFIFNKYKSTAIAKILIFRTYQYTKIEIHTAQAKKLSYQSGVGSKDSNSGDFLGNTNTSSNLKILQQQLEMAILKYKKTLQIFSSWKHDFNKQTEHSSNDKNNPNQELPKLWSYENSQGFNRKTKSTSSDLISKPELENSETELEFLQNDFDSDSKVSSTIGIIIKQLNQPFQYASIFAKYLVSQLERRENTVKQALNRSLKLINSANIKGIKIKVAGRLNGGDMAEQEIISKGRIPLSTIDANIDYYQDIAQTLYGTLGVKVFIFRG